MRRLLVACSALALAAVLDAPVAGAWSQETVGGSGSASRFTDPDAAYDKLGEPGSGARSNATEASPFSLGVRRSDDPYRRQGYRRIDPPKALHPNSEHLYWGNTSDR